MPLTSRSCDQLQIPLLLALAILAQLCRYNHKKQTSQRQMVAAACNLSLGSCCHSLEGSRATWIRSTTLQEFYKHTPAGTHQLISGDSWMVASHFFFSIPPHRSIGWGSSLLLLAKRLHACS
ncbi:hypothetical protein HDV63DRAFT_131732 [Trichoderma sp. SZMC 28014]